MEKSILHRQNVFLDFRTKPQHTKDLSHTSSSDSFPVGDIRLVADLAIIELASPLDGLPQEFGYAGGLGHHWLREIAPGQRNAITRRYVLANGLRRGGDLHLLARLSFVDVVGVGDRERWVKLRFEEMR